MAEQRVSINPSKSVYIRVLNILKLPLFALAFVPLVVTGSLTLFPFIFGKSLLIRSAVTLFWILFAAYLIYHYKSGGIRINPRLFKNPIFIFTSLFVLLMLFSTALAVNPYRAFFGDIERGEGYLGLLYFYGFFVAALLVFDRRDWFIFFKLSLLVGALLLFYGLSQLGTFPRLQSFIGNPAFLAAYYLYLIFGALVLIFLEKDRSWRYLGGIGLLLALVGIFFTQTRGAIVGLLAGVILAIVYFAFRGRGLKIGRVELQKISLGLIGLFLLGLGILLATRESVFWQKVPGVNRLVTISRNDPTVATRLISAGVSINAIRPAENGWERTLLGWGPENFLIAYNKHYNPQYLKYENFWFDRAHNKIFDVLVMNGVLGLIAYLGIWLSILYLLFSKPRLKADNESVSGSEKSASSRLNPYLSGSIIFFAAAYFVQNLFLFDQISTYIPFFAFLAFVAYETQMRADKKQIETDIAAISIRQHPYLSALAGLAAIFFLYFLVTAALIPFYQMVKFTSAIKSGLAQRVYDQADQFSRPYNFAQAELRYRLLSLMTPYLKNEGMRPLIDKALALEEEVLQKEPYDPRKFILVGDIYEGRGNQAKALEYDLKALSLSPRRQELLYNVAVDYAQLGDIPKMEETINRMLNDSPNVPRTKMFYATAITKEGAKRFNEGMGLLESALNELPLVSFGDQDLLVLRNIYNLYLNYFYDQRDADRFLAAMERARQIELKIEEINEQRYKSGLIQSLPPKKSEDIARGIEGFKKYGWAAINKQ